MRTKALQKGGIFFTIMGLILFLTSSTVEIARYKVKKIVIDAGHGGKDPGCSGKTSKEAKVVLAVALALGDIIKENMPEVKIIYTRDENKFVELHDRAEIANKNGADLFVSIHCNAGHHEAHGTEIYTMGLHTSEGNLDVAKRENSVILQESDYKKNYNGYDPKSPMSHILMANYQHAYISNSIKLASLLDNQFKERVGRSSRGVKQAGFLVLWKTAMPSILIELGYLTNKQEEKFLASDESQGLMASAIYRAIKDYKALIETEE